ncbi:activator-dependent family glycosyltransferase [Micromonospora aurantiaca (nom. illeg.)]|nr:activator-dependent family glycosyltransferase [Micromonospora sp. WMMB235]OHX01523.1 glycosyl transferase family 28 [Micromonospora sp. WMMB235]
MRVLFTTFAQPTHLHAQVPLAWALRAAGHDVRVASQPDLTEAITGAGLTAVAVGEPLNQQEQVRELDEQHRREVEEAPDDEPTPADYIELTDISELRDEILTYEYVQRQLTAVTMFGFRTLCPDRMIDDLVAFARDWRPDLVVWDSVTFAGAVAAIASGAAHGRLLFGLDLVGHVRQRHLELLRGRVPALRDDPLQEWLGDVLARHGHPFTEQAVLGQFTIDPVPASLRLPVDHHYLPMRYTPYNGPATVPDWLREPPTRPRVCLTLGRSFRETLGGDRTAVTELLDAVATLDVDVVATLSNSQIPPGHPIPDNVRTVEFVNLDVLLPTCAAIIHHGGSGTSQTALIHGVPQVIVPYKLWCNGPRAERMERAGVAVCGVAGRSAASEVRALIRRVLDEPSFRACAGDLRHEMLAASTPAELVPVLRRLAQT